MRIGLNAGHTLNGLGSGAAGVLFQKLQSKIGF